jgi:hypothetical protein
MPTVENFGNVASADDGGRKPATTKSVGLAQLPVPHHRKKQYFLIG